MLWKLPRIVQSREMSIVVRPRSHRERDSDFLHEAPFGQLHPDNILLAGHFDDLCRWLVALWVVCDVFLEANRQFLNSNFPRLTHPVWIWDDFDADEDGVAGAEAPAGEVRDERDKVVRDAFLFFGDFIHAVGAEGVVAEDFEVEGVAAFFSGALLDGDDELVGGFAGFVGELEGCGWYLVVGVCRGLLGGEEDYEGEVHVEYVFGGFAAGAVEESHLFAD